MDEHGWLAERFEDAERTGRRSVAKRDAGIAGKANRAVHDAWFCRCAELLSQRFKSGALVTLLGRGVLPNR
jgi:hypothetical protein